MTESKLKVEKIVEYWNTELLCSDASSTSRTDPDIAILDNAIENRVLGQLLGRGLATRYGRCLDIGAGFGRFTNTLRDSFAEIVLLEAAENIFRRLEDLWAGVPEVETRMGDFESFVDDQPFDTILASGILYLYDDQMTARFIQRAADILKRQGLLIFRDFIASPPRTLPSNYVERGFCFYRDQAFWNGTALANGLETPDITGSKPRLGILRRQRTLSILRAAGFHVALTWPVTTTLAMAAGDWRLTEDRVNTVFIVMRKP